MDQQNQKKTILHCIDSLSLGGAEVLLMETLPLLTEYDNVVCYLHPPDTLLSQIKDYPVYCLGYRSKFSFFKTVRKLRQVIKKNNVSIVHAHLFYSTLFTRIACSSRLKFIFTIHSLLSKDAFEVNRLSLFAERITYKKRQLLIGVSQASLDDYNRWIGIKGKSFVLNNYVNDKYFEINLDHKSNIAESFKLIAVGNLKRAKNYSALLDAFSITKDLPVTLDIYGSGDLKNELQKKIVNENLNVRLMGQANEIWNILPDYDAYIMPSLYEGFGIASMEAIAAGLPVLLSDIPVFRELVENIPVYFNPADPESIANAIRYTYNNWQKVILNAAKGKQLIQKKASKEVYLTKLLEIYNS